MVVGLAVEPLGAAAALSDQRYVALGVGHVGTSTPQGGGAASTIQFSTADALADLGHAGSGSVVAELFIRVAPGQAGAGVNALSPGRAERGQALEVDPAIVTDDVLVGEADLAEGVIVSDGAVVEPSLQGAGARSEFIIITLFLRNSIGAAIAVIVSGKDLALPVPIFFVEAPVFLPS